MIASTPPLLRGPSRHHLVEDVKVPLARLLVRQSHPPGDTC